MQLRCRGFVREAGRGLPVLTSPGCSDVNSSLWTLENVSRASPWGSGVYRPGVLRAALSSAQRRWGWGWGRGCCDASDSGPESGVVARAQACWARLERWASSLSNLPSFQACTEAPRLLRSPPVSCPAAPVSFHDYCWTRINLTQRWAGRWQCAPENLCE